MTEPADVLQPRSPTFKFDSSHTGLVRLATTIIGVAMALYHMWTIAFGTPEAIIFRGTHLIFALALALGLASLTALRFVDLEDAS